MSSESAKQIATKLDHVEERLDDIDKFLVSLSDQARECEDNVGQLLEENRIIQQDLVQIKLPLEEKEANSNSQISGNGTLRLSSKSKVIKKPTHKPLPRDLQLEKMRRM